MTEISIDTDKQFCLYCRKPLQKDFSNETSSEYHIECQELMHSFNTDKYSPYSLYEDFNLVKDFFNDLISNVPNNGGLEFLNFLRDSCFWNNDGKLLALKIFGGFLQSIPPSIMNFSKLTTLIIHNNRYLSLPDELIELQNLEHIELHLNSFYKQNYPIPEVFFEKHALKRLFLSGYFSSIEAPFSSFPLLEELRLIVYRDEKKNLEFPSSLCSCYNLNLLQINSKFLNLTDQKFNELSFLQELDLASNNLDKIPQSLAELSALQKLNLSSNRFKNIPECLSNLPRLEELDLSMNMIQKVPDFMEKSRNLQQLILTDNPLKEKNFEQVRFKVYH